MLMKSLVAKSTGYFSLLLVILIFACPLKAAEQRQEDLPNFHIVHPYLYRGGEPNEAGLEKLHRLGVTTIIDLRAPSEKTEKEKAITQRLNMKYIDLPMASQAPTKSQVETFLQSVDAAKSEESTHHGPVFVHCWHGSDRTGCMVGIWRVSRDGWNYAQAYSEMLKYYFSPKFTELSGAVKKYSLLNPAPAHQ
jgi:protein tyrosine/serine phosphatase